MSAKPSNPPPLPASDHEAEDWRDIAARASIEQDPKKLTALLDQLNQMLEQREQRMKAARSQPTTPTVRERQGKTSDTTPPKP